MKMELIIKACAAALITVIVGLIIKRSNAEITLSLSACCVAVIMLCALRYAESIKDLTELVNNILGPSDEYILPILKCLGIAIATKFASELCRDASQGAVSASVEFAGIVCALCVSMPLLMNVLKMLGGLI